MNGSFRPRTIVVGVLAMTLAAVSASCGSAVSTPTPGASTAMTAEATKPARPAPTAKPDPAALTLSALRDDKETVHLTLDMTETATSAMMIDGVPVSPAPSDLVLEFGGEVLMKGDDHLARLKASGENGWVVESIRADGHTMRRFLGEGWLPAADETRLPDILRGAESLEFLGTVERAGQTLNRFALRTEEPIQLSSIWFTDSPSGQTDEGTLELLATANGAPVAALLTIRSDDMSMRLPGGPEPAPRTYRLEAVWHEAPNRVSMPDPLEELAPTPVNEHRLSIGLPPAWTPQTVDASWVWYQGQGRSGWIGITRWEMPEKARSDAPAAQLDGWSSAFIRSTEDAFSSTALVLEPALVAGLPGRLATYHLVGDRGREYTQIDAMFVAGGWTYAIRWESDSHFDLVSRYRFERILESIVLFR